MKIVARTGGIHDGYPHRLRVVERAAYIGHRTPLAPGVSRPSPFDCVCGS